MCVTAYILLGFISVNGLIKWNGVYFLLFMAILNCTLYSDYLIYLLLLQIFISRDGGNKRFASVLGPGQHEGLR